MCGSRGGCAVGVAAEGAALEVRQPRGLRWRCDSPGGCAGGLAAEGAAPRVWQPTGLRHRCGSPWCPRGCAEGVVSYRYGR